MRPLTYYEYPSFWGVVYVGSSDHSYYVGPFKCRSTAYRHARKENEKHRWANQHGYLYNTRAM